MEQLAHRCLSVAAAALCVGGLVGVLTSIAPALPDQQIRDIDLAAANVDVGPGLEIIDNHVRPDIVGSGGGDDGQFVDLGSMLYGSGDDAWGVGTAMSTADLDETLLTELAGGNFDPQTLLLGSPFAAYIGGVEVPGTGTFNGVAEQDATSVAANMMAGFSMFLNVVPETQQALNNLITTTQLEFNLALVAAQQAAADRLFGDSPELYEAVNWIFSINNSVLAQNQETFNSMMGISYDTRPILLGNFDLTEPDWDALFAMGSAEFNEIIEALQADNLALLLGSIDWEGLFAGMF
ncbi:hypothetical protein [Mycolicibacter hiberniae]|nr:hypothetical protein [Mycolicibacter hiberniae]MCV7086676.1 hypothetical protein [Mycolicibacter hiberniae]ORV67019.1 hypothetical protein AWC09_19090 [Mycolicibacter hiberniae]